MQLPLGDQDGVQELLDLWVASLGVRQDLANKVYGVLHFEGVSLFLSLYLQGDAGHLCGDHDVEQERLSIGQGTRIGAFIRISLTLSSAS